MVFRTGGMLVSVDSLMGYVIALMLALISSLLTYIAAVGSRQAKRTEDLIASICARLETKVDHSLCDERRDSCTLPSLVVQFRKHAHTGLPPDSILYVRED